MLGRRAERHEGHYYCSRLPGARATATSPLVLSMRLKLPLVALWRMGCQRAVALRVRVRGWVGGERRSCLYRPVGSRGLGEIGVLVRRCMSKMSRQAARRKGAPAGAKG